MYHHRGNTDKDLASILTTVVRSKPIANKEDMPVDTVEILALVKRVLDIEKQLDVQLKKLFLRPHGEKYVDDLLLDIFRLAALEFTQYPPINRKILLNEYVSLVAGFYNRAQIDFANAILDNLSTNSFNLSS
jgi:transcription termination factor NusB